MSQSRRRLSSNDPESCHGLTIYTIVTFFNRAEDQIKRAGVVVLRGEIYPVNAARVLPKHQQQDSAFHSFSAAF